MKLICLLGSPRREGNSATIAAELVTKAQELGAETETVYLNELTYRGCQACYACKKGSETCVIKDDLAPVLEKVKAADAVVFASPVYYGDVTAQLKSFIDRTFSYLVPDYATNPVKTRVSPVKPLALILVQGHPDEALFGDVFPRYKMFLSWLGFEGRLVRACGLNERSDVRKRTDVMAAAREAAEALVG